MTEHLSCPYDIEGVLRSVFKDDSFCYNRLNFAGGLTNYNYIIKYNRHSYVVREPGFKSNEMIDRAAEQINNEITSKLGINSKCIYFDSETGIKISRLVSNAQTFSDLNPASEPAMHAAVSLLKTIHNSNLHFTNVFDWQKELDKYEGIVRSLCCPFFSDYETLRKQIISLIEQAGCVFLSRPCHNDTVPENFLMRKRDRKAFLIDWEYSGMNDPAWDVAMYIRESYLSPSAIDRFLSLYYGTSQISEQEEQKLKMLIMAQDLLWSVWAMIRYYNGEDFLDYLYSRYNRSRSNLKKLSSNPAFPISEMVRR